MNEINLQKINIQTYSKLLSYYQKYYDQVNGKIPAQNLDRFFSEKQVQKIFPQQIDLSHIFYNYYVIDLTHNKKAKYSEIASKIFGQRLIDQGLHIIDRDAKIINKSEYKIDFSAYKHLFIKYFSIFVIKFKSIGSVRIYVLNDGENSPGYNSFIRMALNFAKQRPQNEPSGKIIQPYIQSKQKSRLRRQLWSSLQKIYRKIRDQIQTIKRKDQSKQEKQLITYRNIQILKKINEMIHQIQHSSIIYSCLIKNFNNFQQFATDSIRLICKDSIQSWKKQFKYNNSEKKGINFQQFRILFNKTFSCLIRIDNPLQKRQFEHRFLQEYYKRMNLDNNKFLSFDEYTNWIDKFIGVTAVNYQRNEYYPENNECQKLNYNIYVNHKY